MKRESILIIGAAGQIGTELTVELRSRYGTQNIIATDLRAGDGILSLDVMNKQDLHQLVRQKKVTQIYLLAAMLSATGEQYPQKAWALNMQSLLNTLEVMVEEKVNKLFWPSSIAVFGPDSPRINCPQQTIIEPSTIYGISKQAGEHWCAWYHQKYGLDIRSLRFPGLISHTAPPGGGTTDYAVAIFHEAIKQGSYTCFLKPGTALPMMYMPDAVRATLELMKAEADSIRVRTSYNIASLSFTPQQLAEQIGILIPGFEMNYEPDYRQQIADSWPTSLDDSAARDDWGWRPSYDLQRMTSDMIFHIRSRYLVPAH